MRDVIVPVLMCGGSGKRLWPLSRAARPKQFLALTGETSLFQDTVARTSHADSTLEFAAPLLVTGAEQVSEAEHQLDSMGVCPQAVLLEPEPRDTAAAVAAACLWMVQQGWSDRLLMITPCDHQVADLGAFRASMAAATALARTGVPVIFGIQPDRPATGFGYIQAGQADGDPGLPVQSFREKPDEETARQFLSTGGYYWNAGIFMFTAQTGLDALRRYAPGTVDAVLRALAAASRSGKRLLLDQQAFLDAPRVSFDVAVMERLSNARVLPADWDWSDVGSWAAVYDVSTRDAQGNAVSGEVLLEDCRGVLARSEGPVITAIGLDDLVVIATADAVFIAPRRRSEDLKQIVSRLEADGRTQLL